MRRFANGLAVYFGLKADETPAPPPERPTPRTLVALVVASMITAVVLDALVSSSTFDLTHALWHGVVLSVLSVIARFVEYHVRKAPDDQRPRSDPSASV